MLELMEDRNRPAVKRWAMPGLLFQVFSMGVGVGILIERRSTDFLAWSSIVFVGILVWGLYWRPLLEGRLGTNGNHGH